MVFLDFHPPKQRAFIGQLGYQVARELPAVQAWIGARRRKRSVSGSARFPSGVCNGHPEKPAGQDAQLTRIGKIGRPTRGRTGILPVPDSVDRDGL